MKTLLFKVLLLAVLYISVEANTIKSTKTVPQLKKRYDESNLVESKICASKRLYNYLYELNNCLDNGGNEIYLSDHYYLDCKLDLIGCIKRSEDKIIRYYDGKELEISEEKLEEDKKYYPLKISKKELTFTNPPKAIDEFKFKNVMDIIKRKAITYNLKKCLSEGMGNEFYYNNFDFNYYAVCLRNTNGKADVLINRGLDHICKIKTNNDDNTQYYENNGRCLNYLKGFNKVTKGEVDINSTDLENSIEINNSLNGKETLLSFKEIECFEDGGSEFYYDPKTSTYVCLDRTEYNIIYLSGTTSKCLSDSYYISSENRKAICDESVQNLKAKFNKSDQKYSECWSKKFGYECCDNYYSTIPVEPLDSSNPKERRWYGVENNQWCGLMLSDDDESCWSEKYGYECCKNKSTSPVEAFNKYNPNDPRLYGIEGDHWCGIPINN